MSKGNVTKTPMMDIYIRVIGVKKRQRTVKSHNIEICSNLPYEDIDLTIYKSQALDAIRKEMKSVQSCKLCLSPWTEVKEDGYEHSMKGVRFADPRYKSVMIEDAWRSV